MSYPPQHGREGHYPTAPGPLFIQNKNDNDNRITQYPIYSNYGGSYGGSNGGYGGGYGSGSYPGDYNSGYGTNGYVGNSGSLCIGSLGYSQSYGASLAPAQPQISQFLLDMLGGGSGYGQRQL